MVERKGVAVLLVFTLACGLPSLWAETGSEAETGAQSAVEMAKELVSGHQEDSGGNPGRGEMGFDRFVTLMGKTVASGEHAEITEVIDEVLSNYTSTDEKRENALNYVWLNIFKGRVELVAGNYRSARESFDEANRAYPPGLIGGPWREFTYGMSLSYWKAGVEPAFEINSDFYNDTGRHAGFSDPGVMEFKDILFIEDKSTAELEATLETYRERGYADVELDLLRDYHDWIAQR